MSLNNIGALLAGIGRGGGRALGPRDNRSLSRLFFRFAACHTLRGVRWALSRRFFWPQQLGGLLWRMVPSHRLDGCRVCGSWAVVGYYLNRAEPSRPGTMVHLLLHGALGNGFRPVVDKQKRRWPSLLFLGHLIGRPLAVAIIVLVGVRVHPLPFAM